jgi:REP-associated tyrosine transposase
VSRPWAKTLTGRGAPLGSCFGTAMPRKPRGHVVGGIFHVTSRGNRGVAVFLDDVTRRRFLHMLGRTIARSNWRCLAYCLMTNHFHVLVAMEKPTLSAGMHWLNGCYAQWFNRRHGFKGHVFEDRFHSDVVESQAHLLELSRYVPLNPVRAGICTHPADWPWSSYLGTIGRERVNFLSAEAMLQLFARSDEKARTAYEAFVTDGLRRVREAHGQGTVPGTWLDQPKPYTPAKRFARMRTKSAAGRPTTFR